MTPRLRRFAASAPQGICRFAAISVLVLVVATTTLGAHAGPPFPIVTDAVRGPYSISIWTDPDATDDGTKGGQFWIVINPATKGASIPRDTRAAVSVLPLTKGATSVAIEPARTEPVRGDVSNQFGAVLMEHEGPYTVRVEVTGPLGLASIDTMVDATYDLRPPPYMLAWYLAPFLLVGFLWTRLLLRRRTASRRPSDRVRLP
jgi:hypothetical protein